MSTEPIVPPINEPSDDPVKKLAEAQAEIERLKGHHKTLLDETKTAKQRAAELEKARLDEETNRQHENGEYKTLAEKYKAEAEAERKANLELKGSVANKELDAAAMLAANSEANTPANAKILARFIRDNLEYVEGAVVGKDGVSVEDAIKSLLDSGDYDALRKGIQSSGGGASGGKNGGGAAKGDFGGNKAERQAAIANRFKLPNQN